MTGRASPRTFLADCRGAAAAELALILPLALILIFTMMEGGYYLQTEHKATKYVREGARYAARQNFSRFDCSGTGAFSDADSKLAAIKNTTLTGYPTGGSARIEGWTAGDINVTVSCDGNYNSGLYRNIDDAKAPIVTVWTRFSYSPILGRLGFDASSVDVVAQSQAAVMGL